MTAIARRDRRPHGGGPDVVVLSHRIRTKCQGSAAAERRVSWAGVKPRLVLRSGTRTRGALRRDGSAVYGPVRTACARVLDQGARSRTRCPRDQPPQPRGMRADRPRACPGAQLANQRAAIDPPQGLVPTVQVSTSAYGQSASPGPPWSRACRWQVIGPQNVAQAPAVAKERATNPGVLADIQGARLPAGLFDPPPPERRRTADGRAAPSSGAMVVGGAVAAEPASLLRIVTRIDPR